MKISNGLEMIELTASLMIGPGIIHPVLMWDDNTSILVDTGTPGLLPALREETVKAGVPFDRLDRIIITHSDMDHIGNLAGIIAASAGKIEVLAHEKEKPYIQCELPPVKMKMMETQLGSLSGERGSQMKGLYERMKAGYKNLRADVDRTVCDGEVLPYCGGITVIYTPGHTPGHICLYHNSSRTLIAGDALNVNDDRRLVPAPASMAYDTVMSADSLKKLAEYDVETVICYHGGLYRDDPNRSIAGIAGA